MILNNNLSRDSNWSFNSLLIIICTRDINMWEHGKMFLILNLMSFDILVLYRQCTKQCITCEIETYWSSIDGKCKSFTCRLKSETFCRSPIWDFSLQSSFDKWKINSSIIPFWSQILSPLAMCYLTKTLLAIQMRCTSPYYHQSIHLIPSSYTIRETFFAIK